ncbi:hypothetical protein NE237_021357 [Protea cynaroides]|uniref:Gag protein n=1 Tax=Protea cynaroides TaxID=273540 RepID=A0A9Q0H7T8_9MAGN|nr:hypothetical protein NE237_021357 [Protea cynaroides]
MNRQQQHHQQLNNPYSQSYNLGWRNHPNFSWRDHGNQGSSSKPFNPSGFQPRPQGVVQQPETKPSWELAIVKLANVTLERIERMETKVDQLTTYNRNLEIQMGQLANAFNSRGQGNLPSKTEINPKEQCKVITLRSDALAQIPAYAKFLKEIMSNKWKLEDYETIALTDECSAVIQNKLPPKLRDPWSFSIPCTIGEVDFSRALCDLGMTNDENLEVAEMAYALEDTQTKSRQKGFHFENLGKGKSLPPPSNVQAPVLELKPLPPHLRYAFLDENDNLPIIVSASLSNVQLDKLLRVLRLRK